MDQHRVPAASREGVSLLSRVVPTRMNARVVDFSNVPSVDPGSFVRLKRKCGNPLLFDSPEATEAASYQYIDPGSLVVILSNRMNIVRKTSKTITDTGFYLVMHCDRLGWLNERWFTEVVVGRHVQLTGDDEW